MCGISGTFSSRLDKDYLVRDSITEIAHRGPDEEGFYTGKNCSLGMCRLSIIDVEHGQQPNFNGQRTIVSVFNGEIYNYKSLKKHLESRFSVIWRGKSDTEVLLECISHLGLDASLTLIDGMFSSALFDMVQNELYLVRDRFGEKPFMFMKKMITFALHLNYDQ